MLLQMCAQKYIIQCIIPWVYITVAKSKPLIYATPNDEEECRLRREGEREKRLMKSV